MTARAGPVLGIALLVGVLTAQEPAPQPGQHPDEGRIIQSIDIRGTEQSEALLRLLETKVEQPLRGALIERDLRTLYAVRRVVAQVSVTDGDDDKIKVTFLVEEPRSYDRVEFRGLDHLTEAQVRELLELATAQRLSQQVAENKRALLEQRYRRDGYYFAAVRIEYDAEASVIRMHVDEGPLVGVRSVQFRGNVSIPGSAPLGLYRNLIGDSGMESKPGFFSDGPYSEEQVDEDLDLLRVLYRRLGYRDAEVELADRRFSADHTKVDLTFRIIEGSRYKIASVDVVHVDTDGKPPYYPRERLLQIIATAPGEYYDLERIARDKREIEEFYGERGHPRRARFSRSLSSPFEVLEPLERFDVDKAEVHLTYRIAEGAPKRLHDVVIRGNTSTQEAVIRRKVFLSPGEVLDMTKVERSINVLDSLNYFQDPDSFAGVRFELLPVPGTEDRVDLAIDVQEGDTGSFLWGAGFSTGAGVQGRIQFTKRNFDLFRLPSSFNPVTIIDEVIHNKAFHGAGQELELFLAPGSEISMFRISFDEPDLFGSHFDTIGMTVQGFRTIRLFDSFTMDSKGAIVGLRRNFDETFSVGASVRQETVQVEDVDADAPAIVWDNEGQTEIRGFEVRMRLRYIDEFIVPSDGYDVTARAELAGGPFGAEQDFYKLGFDVQYYLPLYRDSFERAHVMHVRQRFDFGQGFGDTDDLFLTERFYMGGSNLRGFDQRRAGPTQFGQPLGGEALYLGTLEYQMPLVSTRLSASVQETELVRGALFTDWGLLGTRIDDPTFGELRLSVGFGIRIRVPRLGIPIALDFGWPLMYERTDDRQVFYFSLFR
jgi:outer membrane protein insertion porin family